jgi:hypothetical protein
MGQRLKYRRRASDVDSASGDTGGNFTCNSSCRRASNSASTPRMLISHHTIGRRRGHLVDVGTANDMTRYVCQPCAEPLIYPASTRASTPVDSVFWQLQMLCRSVKLTEVDSRTSPCLCRPVQTCARQCNYKYTTVMTVKEAEPLLPSTPDRLDPPPPFEDEQRSHPSNLNEPPPDFALYKADFFEIDSGDVVSHDPHLNSDGTRFFHRQMLLPEFLATQAKLSTASYSPKRTSLRLAGCIAEVHIPSIVPVGSQSATSSAKW